MVPNFINATFYLSVNQVSIVADRLGNCWAPFKFELECVVFLWFTGGPFFLLQAKNFKENQKYYNTSK